eukprot:4185968-Pleurochrysis_carterae.AAC.1
MAIWMAIPFRPNTSLQPRTYSSSFCVIPDGTSSSLIISSVHASSSNFEESARSSGQACRDDTLQPLG